MPVAIDGKAIDDTPRLRASTIALRKQEASCAAATAGLSPYLGGTQWTTYPARSANPAVITASPGESNAGNLRIATRHATVYTVTFEAGGGRASVVTALQVFRTVLDGGTSSLFAVGKLYDTVVVTDGRVALARRVVKLDTRDLGIGSHVPF